MLPACELLSTCLVIRLTVMVLQHLCSRNPYVTSLMFCHNAFILHLTSSHHMDILSSDFITRRRANTRWYDTLKERNYIHITLITVFCYNYSMLSLAIIGNLFLCLIKFYHRYVCIGKKHSAHRVQYCSWFQTFMGSHGT